jgi:hypothetical protein
VGIAGASKRETTTVVTTGIRMSERRPLAITAILPYSWIAQPGQAHISGVEDVLLGLRYRYELKGLQQKWDREGNFVIGTGALELNNGVIDHGSWTGPLDTMGAILASLERGKWSVIGYSVARFNLENADGDKAGDNLFAGGGVAYTPNEDFETGRLFSYQMGWSIEHYARDRVAGQLDDHSGGDELLLHPTFAFSPGHGVLVFGMASVPVWRDFADRTAQDAYRVGTGLVYAW